jgi:hypothetical protein
MNVEAAILSMQQQVTAAMQALQHLQQTLAALAPPAAAAKKPAGRPKRAIVSLPEPSEDGAPTAGDYRLKEEEINADTCLGRHLRGGEDKRWKPAVYREAQCGGKIVEGSNLCEACSRRLEKYVVDPAPGAWTGLVTEEPLDWVHMLGTAWAEWRQPKWIGDATSAAVSEAGSAASTSAEAAVVVEGELSEDDETIALLEQEEEEALTIAKETFAKTLAKAAAIAEAAKAEKAEKAAAAAKAKAAAAKARAEKAAAVARARAEKAAAAAADAQNKADQAARDVLFLALIAPDDVDAHAE